MTPYAALLLRRLARLCRLRVQYADELSDVGLRLLDRCIHATAADAAAAGCADEAGDELAAMAYELRGIGAWL